MMSASNQQPHPVTGKLVTVFGGSGFLGRFVVQTLARRGYRVRVAVRRPELAQYLQTLGAVGQIHAVQANLRYPESVRAAAQSADAVINLVGILQEGGRQTFDALQTVGAETVARAAVENDARMVHVSAIGADADGPAQYGRTKAEGEARVLALTPQAVILRPSIVFGPGDSFFNRFAALARIFPVLPIASADTRFQPVYAGDVAEAVARAVDGAVEGGKIYELGGPGVYSFRELLAYVLEVTGRKRLIAAMPPALARLQASVTETLDKFTFGLMPDEIVLTRDQLLMLERDNVVSPEAEAEGRSFAGMGITPTSLEAIVPGYLKRFRKHGQFETRKSAA